jgi:site-specific recombinase XerD
MNKRKRILDNIPKLPDQDKYLLDLQNNSYSFQTIINYARDLSIFSVYIFFNNIEFQKLSKENVSNYKGYLKSGNHLKDLDRIREKYMKDLLGTIQINDEAERGSRKGSKISRGASTHNDQSQIEESIQNKGDEVYEEDFLTKVYSKVYGSLGILDRPLNSRARSDDGLDERSINMMLSALRSYLKFRINWDLDIPLPPDAITMVKADKKIKKVASFKDLVKLVESPTEFERDEKIALRNRCMLEMLFASGMRISELINLNLEQLNTEGKVYITGKGRKERTIFLTPRSLNWLNKYLRLRLEYAFSDRMKKEQPGNIDSLFNDLGIEKDNNSVKHRGTSTDSKGLNLEVFDLENRKYISLIESYRKNRFIEKFDSPARFIPFSGLRT